MFPELDYITSRYRHLRQRLLRRLRRREDRGYTTETVLVIALLVVLALAVIGVIASKVIDKANSIDLQ